MCMGQGSASLVFDVELLRKVFPMPEHLENLETDLEHLVSIEMLKKHELTRFDPSSNDPNVFVHNYKWMHESEYLGTFF